MARKDTRAVVSAEWRDPQDGTVVTGTVVRQNDTSVYVEWHPRNRVERILRTDESVTFKTADES